VDGNIFNSKGVHVGVVRGDAVFGLRGQKLYDLKGSNIYKLNGDLVGRLPDARAKEKRLDKTTDKLFPSTWFAEFSVKQFPTLGNSACARPFVAKHFQLIVELKLKANQHRVDFLNGRGIPERAFDGSAKPDNGDFCLPEMRLGSWGNSAARRRENVGGIWLRRLRNRSPFLVWLFWLFQLEGDQN
jgi:hypothetical protein